MTSLQAFQRRRRLGGGVLLRDDSGRADLNGDGRAELFGHGPNGTEVWSYDPTTTGDGREADPLSVRLSLRDTTDERVRHELQELLHKTLS